MGHSCISAAAEEMILKTAAMAAVFKIIPIFAKDLFLNKS
jgi:hypothetical protein